MNALSRFAGHLRRRTGTLVLLFALGLAGSAAALSTPLIGKAFIDAVVERGDFAVIPLIAAALVVLAITDVAIGFVSRRVHARLSAGILIDLRERLLRHCLYTRIEGIERFRHGDLLTRFGSDVPRIQALLVDGLIGFVHNALFLIVCAVILVWLSPILALWSYLGLGIALLLTAAFRRPVEAGSRAIRENMADLSHFLSERLGSLRSVRFHRAEAREMAAFGALNQELKRRVLRFQAVESVAGQLPGLALSVSLAWIYLLGGGLLQDGAIGLGTFVAFVLYQGRLYGPAAGLLGLVRTLQESRVSIDRIAELLEGESPGPCRIRNCSDRRAAVVMDDVHFAYPGGPPVLDGVSLELAPAEKVAVFGASGAGKSTLVQLLFGLRQPSSGSVGIDCDAVGYASADPFLLHASVRENLCYGLPRCSDAQIVEATRLAEATRFILSLPEGFDTVIGGRGCKLSDGQRQRLGLARLFLARPAVMVLDEAFSAMDPETERRVRANLFDVFADCAVLAITHRLTDLQQFDRLLLMSDGRLQQVDRTRLEAFFGSGCKAAPERRRPGASSAVPAGAQ